MGVFWGGREMINKSIATSGSHELLKSKTLSGREQTVPEAIIDECGRQTETEFWKAARVEPIGQHKLFACTWRYVLGQLRCI